MRNPVRNLSLFCMMGLTALGLLLTWPVTTQAGHGGEDVDYIAPERVKALLDGSEKVVFFDLRSLKDFIQKRLPGTRSVPMNELDKRFREIPKSGRVILYCDCRQNQIIEEAHQLLKDYGYRNTAIIADEFREWVRRKYPVEAGGKQVPRG